MYLSSFVSIFYFFIPSAVTVTAVDVKVLLDLCYRLCVRFLDQFGHLSGATSKLSALFFTVAGFLVRSFSKFRIYEWVREHGWVSVCGVGNSLCVSTHSCVCVCVCVHAHVCVGTCVCMYVYIHADGIVCIYVF